MLLDMAALTGTGALGIRLLQARGNRGAVARGLTAEVVARFDSWADSIWSAALPRCLFIAVRDAQSLNTRYPASLERIHRLKISLGAEVIGWAVVRNTQMKAHKQFGDLHVGTIADALSATPAHALLIVQAAREFLKQQGVELIVSNQCHSEWREALKDAGFLSAASNYLFAASPELARMLAPLGERWPEIHFTRGDGDGLIHL